MNKKICLLIFSILMLLSACGTDSTWEEESVEESNRIITDDVKVKWELEKDEASDQGELIRVVVTINGEPIDGFELNHEKLLHLIIVSKDLTYFNHIHPEYKGEGVFEIVNYFPAGGEYRMIADFKPTNGNAMSKMSWVHVEGETAQPVNLKVDNLLEKTIDSMNVQLTVEPGLKAKGEQALKFTLTEGTSKKPITDLEQYLGSIGHVVVLSEDGEQYLHVHALEDQGSGPDAFFETKFPKNGIYKIWAQFQRKGKVFTIPFVVEVQ